MIPKVLRKDALLYFTFHTNLSKNRSSFQHQYLFTQLDTLNPLISDKVDKKLVIMDPNKTSSDEPPTKKQRGCVALEPEAYRDQLKMCFKCGASGGEDIKFKYLNNGIGKPSTVSMHKVQYTSLCLDIKQRSHPNGYPKAHQRQQQHQLLALRSIIGNQLLHLHRMNFFILSKVINGNMCATSLHTKIFLLSNFQMFNNGMICLHVMGFPTLCKMINKVYTP